jgi:hypothetical protein
MKTRKVQVRPDLFLAFPLALASGALVMATTLPPPARASADLDRKYALETIGILRPYDNLDGMFADVVSSAFREWLSRREQSRFVHQDLSAADPILAGTRLPYIKVIDDKDILKQITRTTRTESLVRTRVLREGPRYRVTLEWLHAPAMDIIATETFSLDEPRGVPGVPADLSVLRTDLQKGLERLLNKTPIMGQVTGRDGETITLNLGRNDRIEKGDTLIFGTIEDAKRHPILKTIVDWRFVETGRAIVGDIDENMIFARVLEELPGRKVARWQKVVKVLPAVDPSKPEPVAGNGAVSPAADGSSQKSVGQLLPPLEPPRLGYITVGPTLGTIGREYMLPAEGAAAAEFRAGSSMVFGGLAEGQLWLDQKFFFDGKLGYTLPGGYSQKNADGTETLSSVGSSVNLMSWRIAGGYMFRATRDVLGPMGYIRVGYGVDDYGFTVNEAEYVGSTQFSGVNLGLGGDLPLRGNLGLKLSTDFGLLQSMTETGLSSGDPQGVTSVKLGIEGYGWWGPKLRVGGGLHVASQSVAFDNDRTISTLGIAFGPNFTFFF